MASVGTLTLDVRANTQKFAQAMDSVDKKIGTFTKSAKNLTSTLGILAGATGLALVIKKNLETADAIGKAADTVALTTKAYQELAFAAQLSGTEQSQFNSNMTAFVKRVGEARAETGPLTSFLKKYDETLLSNIKNTSTQEEALYIMAEAIRKAKTETDRAALANAAFSRAGVPMTILLRDGAEGLDKMRQRAQELGLVMEDKLIRNSEEASDRVDELSKVLSLKLTKAVADNADKIEKFATSIINLITALGNSITKLNEFGKAIGDNIADSLSPTETAQIALFNKQLDEINKKIELFGDNVSDFQLSAWQQQAKTVQAELDKIAEKRSVLFGTEVSSKTGQPITTPKIQAEIVPTVTATTISAYDINQDKELQKLIDTSYKKLQALTESLQTEEERINQSYQNRQGIIDNALDLQIIDKQRRDELIKKLEEQHQKEIIDIQLNSYDEQIRLAQTMGEKKASAVLGTLQNITAGVSQSSRAIFEINKAAAKADAILNIPAAASGAYRYGAQIGGPVLGAAFAAAAVAAQIAQVDAINSSTFGGGVPPSAAGTGASSVVATTPLDGGQPQTQPTTVFDIHITGNPDSDQIRELIDMINEETSDNYELRVS